MKTIVLLLALSANSGTLLTEEVPQNSPPPPHQQMGDHVTARKSGSSIEVPNRGSKPINRGHQGAEVNGQPQVATIRGASITHLFPGDLQTQAR
jgi:hypothetical protein